MNYRNMTTDELLQVVDDLNGHIRPEYVIELAARLEPFADLDPARIAEDAALAAVAREYADTPEDFRRGIDLGSQAINDLEDARELIEAVAAGDMVQGDLEVLAAQFLERAEARL